MRAPAFRLLERRAADVERRAHSRVAGALRALLAGLQLATVCGQLLTGRRVAATSVQGIEHRDERASISEFESGRKKPKPETLRKWLRALQLPDDWADLWIEYQIEQDVRDVLERRRGPRAMAKEDVDAITRMVRRSWGRG